MPTLTVLFLVIGVWAALVLYGVIDWIRKNHQAALQSLIDENSEVICQLITDQHSRMVALRNDHEVALKQERQSVARIMEKACRIQFDMAPGGHYQVNVMLDRRIMEQSHYMREDFRLLADLTADRVRVEIASGRFVGSAHESKYRRERAEYGRPGIDKDPTY